MRHKSVHRHGISGAALVVSLRYMAHRYALWLAMISAVAIFAFAQAYPHNVSHLRMRLTELTLSAGQIISAPMTVVDSAYQRAAAWHDAVNQNELLRAENQKLRAWQQEAMRLQAENTRLRNMLQAPAPITRTALTVPVVSDTAGNFQRTLLAMAGINNAVEVGAVALGAAAVIGNVVEVGNRTARILLLTDLNSRIPVRLESSGEQAIAAGNSGALLDLKYMADDVTPQLGERVVTSGHGGIYPAGLPVGTIIKDGDGFAVLPLENTNRLEWVRILDYRNPKDIIAR